MKTIIAALLYAILLMSLPQCSRGGDPLDGPEMSDPYSF